MTDEKRPRRCVPPEFIAAMSHRNSKWTEQPGTNSRGFSKTVHDGLLSAIISTTPSGEALMIGHDHQRLPTPEEVLEAWVSLTKGGPANVVVCVAPAPTNP